MNRVVKYDGRVVPFDISKIKKFCQFITKGTSISPIELESMLTVTFRDNMPTTEIQDSIQLTLVNNISDETPEFAILAGRCYVYNSLKPIRKTHGLSYKTVPFHQYFQKHLENGIYSNKVGDVFNEDDLLSLAESIDPNLDYDMGYGAALLFMNRYLIKRDGVPIELPQYATMAIAMYMNIYEENKVIETRRDYDLISRRILSPGTPTKSNLRKPNGNGSSCFIVIPEDNIESLFKVFKDIALISKAGGGIGVDISNIRGEGSDIQGTPAGNYITAWERIINAIAIAVDQLKTRKGAITIGLAVWHYDVDRHMTVKSETGDPRLQCFDIFPQIIVNNVFMDRVKNYGVWYLVDHTEVRRKLGIDITEPNDMWNKWSKVEEAIENGILKRFKKKDANEFFLEIISEYFEVGDIYITNIENANRMNPMEAAGYCIRALNLCVESFSPVVPSTDITTIYDAKENKVNETYTPGLYHTCNLLSINLAELIVTDGSREATTHIDMDLLEYACRRGVRMLDKVVTITDVPIVEGRLHADMFRTINIGIIGLADWMAWNFLSYTKVEDMREAEKLVEQMSYWIFEESSILAGEKGSFPAFEKSNFKDGILLGRTGEELDAMSLNGLDWSGLIKNHTSVQMRNLITMAIAPNTSTGTLMDASASYLPVYSRFFYDEFMDLKIPTPAKFLKDRYMAYQERINVSAVDIIRLTVMLQRWIDTGLSMELVINPDIITVDELADAIIDGFDNGLKAVYYSRTLGKTANKDKKLTRSLEQGCTSCAN